MDAYTMVTDQILSIMEQGIIPWNQPYSVACNCGWSRSTGKAYSLVNQILLAGDCKDCKTVEDVFAKSKGEWVTFKQATEEKGHVKKGEHGRKIIFFTFFEPKDEDEQEDEESPKNKHACLKAYTVFNVNQCEGLEQKYNREDVHNDIQQDTTAEEVIADYLKRAGLEIITNNDREPYYSVSGDYISTPAREKYVSAAEYYGAIFHEIIHSTGAASRLNRRDLEKSKMEAYSVEELVAEIGAASICATLGLDTTSSTKNAAAYVQSWMQAIQNDKRMFVIAAARAEKAIRLVLNITDDAE